MVETSKIAKDLEKYNESKLLVGKSFIDKTCFDLIDYYGLHDYLKNVRTCGTRKSYYCFANKTMYLELNRTRRYLNFLKKEFGDEAHYWYNLVEVLNLFHEIEHVKQEPLKEEKFNSMESRLVYLNNVHDYDDCDKSILKNLLGKLKLVCYLFYYNDNHDLAPIERLANIKSCLKMFELLDDMDKFDVETVKIFEGHIIDLLSRQVLCGYELEGDKTNSPSLDYLRDMKHTDNKRIIDGSRLFNGDSYSLQDRLTYGLSISKDEYEDIQDIGKVLRIYKY